MAQGFRDERLLPSDSIARFIRGMSRAGAYPHCAGSIELLETHISWVFLAGVYAYKVKKPVALGFLDFTSLQSRRHFCEEELRINRRFAPDLYLDVVAVRGSIDAPRVGGTGEVLEYALRMRRFAQEGLASSMLACGRLTREHMVEFANGLARFHAQLPPAGSESSYGMPAKVLAAARANFEQIEPLLDSADDRILLGRLRRWTEDEFPRANGDFRDRRAGGKIRECHGDLHLGNIVEWNGRLVAFDGIEFDPELRWIDVMSDVAFLVMDLLDRSADALAWRFLSAYLEAAGDYAGLAVFRFYLVYRAMVRAKVNLIRARQTGVAGEAASRPNDLFREYLRLANRCAHERPRALVLMHGFSGSGKSVLAAELVERLGAIRIRSDLERKRMHGLTALQSSGSACGDGLYSAEATRDTYETLASAARAVVAAGYRAIVDACTLRRMQRDRFVALARSMRIRLVVVDVRAPREVLQARIAARVNDASEATAEVLEQQLAEAEPIAAQEDLTVVTCESRGSPQAIATELAPRIIEALRTG
jgi:aminoglycoside phosphotransferase family enzyme/predicted kinase